MLVRERGNSIDSCPAHRRIANDALGCLGRVGLELRLDQRHDLAVSGERGFDPGRTRVSEMNDTSMTARLGVSGSAM